MCIIIAPSSFLAIMHLITLTEITQFCCGRTVFVCPVSIRWSIPSALSLCQSQPVLNIFYLFYPWHKTLNMFNKTTKHQCFIFYLSTTRSTLGGLCRVLLFVSMHTLLFCSVCACVIVLCSLWHHYRQIMGKLSCGPQLDAFSYLSFTHNKFAIINLLNARISKSLLVLRVFTSFPIHER